MGALNTTVHVLGDDGSYSVFGPGDELPEWAARRIGAHAFEDGEHPFPEEPVKDDDGDGHPDREFGVEPTRNGPGSSRDAWVAFASEKGHQITEGASRDEIIASLTASGLIESK